MARDVGYNRRNASNFIGISTTLASREGTSKCMIHTEHCHQLSFFTLVLLVSFLFDEAQSCSNLCSGSNRSMMAPMQYTSCFRKMSSTWPSTMRPISAAALAWVAGSPYCRTKSKMRRRGSTIYETNLSCRFPTTHRCRPSRLPSALFAQHDSKQSDLMNMQQPSNESAQATSAANKIDLFENKMQHDGHLWFTELLPEGWCVGVCTDHAASVISNDEDTSSDVSPLLHPDEYEWGQNNIASESSRTSYYLGRMALRSSLKTLLESERDSARSVAMKENNADDENTNDSFYDQLFDHIQNNAIRKDYYGRPILPEIILGSISHKRGYAVGLAKFRSSNWNGSNRVFRGLNGEEVSDDLVPLDATAIKWREECPIIFDEDDNADAASGHGVGIDLEQIDSRRGKRIKRKVLTENEQHELGALDEIGISSEDEVLLRFSLKESVYKAMHPILCHYVGFQEAEVTPLSNGTAQVTLNLTSGDHERLGIVVQSASWKKFGDFFLTSASVGISK